VKLHKTPKYRRSGDGLMSAIRLEDKIEEDYIDCSKRRGDILVGFQAKEDYMRTEEFI